MRNEITEKEKEEVLLLVRKQLDKRLRIHGKNAFNSAHEIRGVLEEEVAEHMDELRANNYSRQLEELLDIAIAAIWGVATIYTLSSRIND